MVREAFEHGVRTVAHNSRLLNAQVDEEPVVASLDGGFNFVDNAPVKLGLFLVRMHHGKLYRCVQHNFLSERIMLQGSATTLVRITT
jgi:hypothetical protein